jgi:serine/threonine protein kinase
LRVAGVLDSLPRVNATGEPSDVPMDRAIAEPLGPDDPREIGQFTIIGLLGAGGMGEVYLGTTGDDYVAVKRVRPRLVTGERFKREVGILFRVPVGVAPSVLATDGTVSRPWFAAEYVPGLTVDEAVRLHGPLPAEALWLLLAETAAQLHKVHGMGIVHRDLKPANVMLVRDGVKLIDFGIARAADQARLTRSGGSYGTRGFTAPEQEAGDENVASPADVYALGALMLYAASGRTPGVVPDVEAMRAVDADLATLIESCFAEQPDARPTAAALEELARMHIPAGEPAWPEAVADRIEVRRAFAATPVGKLETLPPPDEEPTRPPTREDAETGHPTPRRRRRLLVLPIMALLLAGGVIAYVLVPSTSSAHTGAQLGATTTTGNVLTTPTKSAAATSSTQPGHSTSASATSTATTPITATSGTSVAQGGGVSPTTTPATAPATTPATSQTATVVTASSINGVSGADDSEQVSGSEADEDVQVGGGAGCSAWLDSNGTGNLAGVVNTSLFQTCDARLVRSDGIKYEFSQSTGAKKTNFISDQGYTMYICVWDTSSPGSVDCGNKFRMSGTTPVEVQ